MSALRLLLPLSLLFAVGCASPAASYCAQQAECGKLGNKSEEQCVANEEKKIADREADEDCLTYVEAYEALLACQGGLSCAEAALSTQQSPCRSEIEAFNGALISNLGCAF